MEELEMEQEFFFDIPHDFLKVCDFTIPKEVCSGNGFF
jgi:hypothetical protein